MKDKIKKFINIVKRDGIFSSIKRTITYITGNYIKIIIYKRWKFFINKDNISSELDKILDQKKYDRIIVWRSSFGWNVTLYQRPQQIAKCLANDRCLILYEVTRMTDKINFFKKKSENLYLIDYELKGFSNLLFEKLKSITKPKYLELYSTCWEVRKTVIDMYINNGFKLLYEYIDDLSPALSGTDKLPQNVIDIHNYVCDNKDILVVTSATRLYDDILEKRGSKKNIILSSNGVDLDHFSKISNKKISVMEDLKKSYKTIIGYYGALASWFDYNLIRKLAINYPDTAFVLIGIKYDTSFDESKIIEIDNVIFLGAIDYKILPNYAKYFDIAWIPFVINDITLATNPIKVFEYMALRKFIVTSDLPECRKYKSVNIAKKYEDYENFLNYYEQYMNKEYIENLKNDAKNNSWESKAIDIINLLELSEKKQ